MGNKKLIMMSSIPDSAIDEMKELSNLDQSFKLDEEFEQNLKNDEPLWADMVKEHIKNSVDRKRQLMRLEKDMLVDMVFNLESRNETLVNNLIEVEKMYDKLKGEQ